MGNSTIGGNIKLMEEYKLYRVYNGYMGFSLCSSIVLAENEEQAKHMARGIDEHHLPLERYEVELIFDSLDKPQATKFED